MDRRVWSAALLACGIFGGAATAQGDSLWERRNPYTAYLFKDTRARRPGDILTVVVREATLFDGKEDRTMNKNTSAGSTLNVKAGSTAGSVLARTFTGNYDALLTSQRALTGQADYKSDRTFLDRMSVMVVEVLPNGNLVIEGFRERVVANEKKILRVHGLVRPNDIGNDNIVESQFIANCTVTYQGRGAESSFINHGWLGRVMNHLWPF